MFNNNALISSEQTMLFLQRQCSCKENTIAGQEAQVGEKGRCTVVYPECPQNAKQ